MAPGLSDGSSTFAKTIAKLRLTMPPGVQRA